MLDHNLVLSQSARKAKIRTYDPPLKSQLISPWATTTGPTDQSCRNQEQKKGFNCNKLESNKKFAAGMFLPHFLQVLAKQVKK